MTTSLVPCFFGLTAGFLDFLAARYSFVIAALSIGGGAGSAAGAGAATVVSAGFAAESVAVVLDSLALLHADAKTSIPQEISKNFVFIFSNLIVIVFTVI